MTSYPGTRGHSVGAVNQPPKKRSKMETNNSSKPQSSQEDSLHSNQPGYVSSATRVQTDHLKCPVCQEYPRREVYQCDEGHIVCSGCIAQITRCPVCRVIYAKKKIRNRVAEADLDEMTYNCSFRDHGCLTINIPRNRRTAHEIQCGHNSSTTGIKFCQLFNTTVTCRFRICPNFIMLDPQHNKDVIEHLTGKPKPKLPHQKVKIGETTEIQLRLPISPYEPHFQPVKLFEVFNDTTRKTIGYYMLIRRLSIPGRENLSWAIVAFNCATEDLDGGGNPHGAKITANFSIKAKTDQEKRAKDGYNCVPNQSWTVKSTYLKEWEDFMSVPPQDRPPFTFSIPEVFLSNYYKGQDGKVEMTVSFGPLVD